MVLDNGFPWCNMPWRSEPGRGRRKAEPDVIIRNPCKLGMWNVNTLLAPGRLEELLLEMKRLDIEILGLGKIRWEGSRDFCRNYYRFIYIQDIKEEFMKRPLHWTKKKMVEFSRDTIHHSDIITVENMHGQADTVIDATKEKEYLIIMGDFNAVVGESK